VKLAICNDLHFNFVSAQHRRDFIARIEADAVLIAGDIGDARYTCEYLNDFTLPTMVVLGNHDAYHGSIWSMRATLAKMPRPIIYLPGWGVLQYGHTGIIGIDNWCDGRLGDYQRSTFELNDFHLIDELRGPYIDRLSKIQELAEDSATQLTNLLQDVVEHPTITELIILMHVPPFAEASFHRGKPSSLNTLPFYTCKIAGDVLRLWIADHPQINVTVYCGHTHGAADVQILPNLRVIAGEAEYEQPRIQHYREI